MKPSVNNNMHYSFAKPITRCIKFTKREELWIEFWQLDNIFESPGQNKLIVWKTDSQLPIGPHSYTTLDWLWEKTRPFCSLGGSLTFFHPYFLTKVYVLIPSTKYLFLLIKFAYSWSLFTSVTLACTAWLDDIYSSRPVSYTHLTLPTIYSV